MERLDRGGRLSAAPLWLGRAMLAVFMALCAAALLAGVSQGKRYVLAFALALAGVAVVVFLARPVCRLLAGLGPWKAWLILSGVCLLVKGAWVLLVQVPVEGDYAVFWGYAKSLAESEVISGGRYMALFPHIFGYASFLSWFIRLVGPLPLLAQGLNVALSLCAGSLLFLLCRQWWGLRAAVSVYLFWIVCPSQTMYNSLILSEPLYTTLILFFLYLVTVVFRQGPGSSRPLLWGAAAGAAGGLLLRWINGLRPIAAILIIALFLWVFLLNGDKLFQKGVPQVLLPLLGVAVVLYALTGPLWNGRIAQRIGEEPSTTPGYSVLVGFNPASGGRWNQKDSDALYGYSGESGSTAQGVQEQLMEDAKERIFSGEVDFTDLFLQKVRTFLGSDDTCVGYSSAVLRHTNLFSVACNGFYYALLLLCLAGGVGLWRRGSGSPALLSPLYVLGLICAQMLVEVAGRYHYSLLPMLILAAQAALWAGETREDDRAD